MGAVKHIVHLTSVHTRNDIRIFVKMCHSIANSGCFNVSLIVADGHGDKVIDDVDIIDVGKKQNRLQRIIFSSNDVFKKAIDIDGDIYHLHDPELLSCAVKLKKRGKKVIFDAHEDFPKQLLTKPYLKKWQANILSTVAKIYENYVCKKLDYIVTATPTIRDKFLKINKKSIDINNYPLIGELSTSIRVEEPYNEVCFVGGFSEIRGIREILLAFSTQKNIILHLVGDFNSSKFKEELSELLDSENVIVHGFLGRTEVAKILSRCVAGLVTFLNVPNHVEAQPNKMFEYMSAGLPVISSNFPLWKEIIEGNECGICVEPSDPNAIREAVQFLINNVDVRKHMAKNGVSAINSKYNWSIEEIKLLDLYKELLND